MFRKHKAMRVVGALAGAVLLASLTACSGGGSATKAGSSDGKPSGTLDVWVRAAADSQQAYKMIFDKFTDKTGVKIKTFATLTDFETKLSAAAAAHTLPDVVVDDAAQQGNFESQGIITPIDRKSIKGQENLTNAAWESARSASGKYLAVPFSAQADLLFIRSDWLKKLNLEVPKTWADFVKVAKAFTDDDPDGDGKKDTYGVAIPGSTTRGYISWNWSTYLWQNGGEYVSKKNGKVTPTIDSPAAVKAAKWFENLYCTDKVVQPGSLNDVTADTNKAWQTGVAGMYLTGPYAFATSDATPIKGKYIVVAPPAGPANSQVLAEGTNIYLMAGSKNTTAAKALAEFMITPQAQKIGMAGVPTASVVRLPVNTKVDAQSVYKGDPRWATAQKVYQEDAHYEPVALPQWQEMRQDASNSLNSLISSCGNPKAALKQLNDKYTTLLNAGN